MEHPELDYLNLGVASLVNKHAGFSYWTIANRDQTMVSSSYFHYANLKYDFSIEWAVYSTLGAFRYVLHQGRISEEPRKLTSI